MNRGFALYRKFLFTLTAKGSNDSVDKIDLHSKSYIIVRNINSLNDNNPLVQKTHLSSDSTINIHNSQKRL